MNSISVAFEIIHEIFVLESWKGGKVDVVLEKIRKLLNSCFLLHSESRLV